MDGRLHQLSENIWFDGLAGSGPMMICRASQLIQIFGTRERTHGWTEVFQEVLADLNNE